MKKYMSLLLTLSLIFSTFTPANVCADGIKQVSIRVEGISNTIINEEDYSTDKETVYDAVYELLEINSIPIVAMDSQFGKYISALDNEIAGSFGGYDGWMYLVNNESPYDSIDACIISDGDDIVLYYGGFDTYVPKIELSPEIMEAGDEFTVTITSSYDEYDSNWNYIGKKNIDIEGASIDLSGEIYTTDENGEAVITAPATPGNYTLKVGKDRASNYPLLVRSTRDFTVKEPEVTAEKHLKRSLSYIYKGLADPKYGSEWSILALSRGNHKVSDTYYNSYYGSIVQKVKEKGGNLGSSTEYSKLILALTSIGRDISDVGGYNQLEKLADYSKIINQGITGAVYALIAIDTHNYQIPETVNPGACTTRENLIQFILDKEINKGNGNAKGWALSGTNPDIDITAMTVQALAPYYAADNNVRGAVDRAISWLSGVQTEVGGFPGSAWAPVNSQSIAQVITALTELGIDPHTDSRFIKNGNSLVDALLAYAIPKGGFKNEMTDTKANAMATDQGTYALVAYNRFARGKNSLYNMTDIQIEKPLPEGDESIIQIPADERDYRIPVKKEDGNKEVRIEIPTGKDSKVTIELPMNESLPQIEATKGQVSVFIPKGARVTGGDASDIELITSKDKDNVDVKAKINAAIPVDKKLDDILQVFTMGGSSRVQFDRFITLTFKDMKGKEAAYMQGGEIHWIQKYENDASGQSGGKDEYAYDSGNDLIVKTKHFTDFIACSLSLKETPGGGGGASSKGYVTLSIDKLTINKGHVMGAAIIELQSGDTVWTLTKREMDKRKILYEYSDGSNVYIQSIEGDGEFDYGPTSGWMYSVNGNFSLNGASQHKLKNGDVIKWRYTTNLGADLGEDNSKWEDQKGGGSGGNAGIPQNSKEPGDVLACKEEAIDLKEKYQDYGLISSWALESVKRATEKGLIEGSGGKLNPKASVTRAEFAKMFISLLELDIKNSDETVFTDVRKEDWFYPYVNSACKAGIMQGSGSEFKPRDNITREQMAVIIVRALKLQPVKADSIIKDMDKVSSWAKREVETVAALGLMLGSDGIFDPLSAATREMAAVIVMRAYDYKNSIPAENSVNNAESVGKGKIEKLTEQTALIMQKKVPDPNPDSLGGEWTVLSLARSNTMVPKEYYAQYYSNLENELKEKSGKLHKIKYTEYSRAILAVTSIGKDAANSAGYNLLKPLADFNALIRQGINGPIFALLALDSNNYKIPVPEDNKIQTTREMIIDFILKREIDSGGWALGETAKEADPDITAMAIQSLTPYCEFDNRIKDTVDRALKYLSIVQKADGSYANYESANCESAAQVIIALTGLGIDPHKDPRFIKNGNSLLDALYAFVAPEGGFYHTKPDIVIIESDSMATDQGMAALAAYSRFIGGKNRFYDMTDVYEKD